MTENQEEKQEPQESPENIESIIKELQQRHQGQGSSDDVPDEVSAQQAKNKAIPEETKQELLQDDIQLENLKEVLLQADADAEKQPADTIREAQIPESVQEQEQAVGQESDSGQQDALTDTPEPLAQEPVEVQEEFLVQDDQETALPADLESEVEKNNDNLQENVQNLAQKDTSKQEINPADLNLDSKNMKKLDSIIESYRSRKAQQT